MAHVQQSYLAPASEPATQRAKAFLARFPPSSAVEAGISTQMCIRCPLAQHDKRPEDQIAIIHFRVLA